MMWINSLCYTSQLKYVFWLEENVSHVIGQNSMTPLDEQNFIIPWGNNNFGLARDLVVHLETAANLCASRPDVKQPLKSSNVSTSNHYSRKSD